MFKIYKLLIVEVNLRKTLAKLLSHLKPQFKKTEFYFSKVKFLKWHTLCL